MPGGQVIPDGCATHGGPAWLWSDRTHASWHDWGQYLAANGYAVLLPNPRGSIGRGPSFTTAGFDDVGGGEWTDILAGVDHVVELGVADPDLLGIGGWSWGGYLTAWGITQTTRFKAAVVGAGVTNLFSDQGNSNLTHFYDYLFSTNAYTDPDAYVRRSPICCVSNVVTPTLVLHGAEDAVVNRAQGQELYNALRYLGQEVEMAIYPREGHGFKERRHQLDLIRRVLEWFDRHLKRESE
ncbi:MAG: prolyl oligopeptidase family serine peptidase [Chloroflexia bacterium]